MKKRRTSADSAQHEALTPLRTVLILWALLIVLLFMIQPSTTEVLLVAVLALTGGGV